MKYLDLMARGGVMMWPILVCLLIAAGVVVDRILAFRRIDSNPGKFLATLRNLQKRQDENGIIALCGERATALGGITREVFTLRGDGAVAVWRTVDSVCRTELYHLERRLPLLWLSAIAAPMLGMFGTLLTLISALKAVELHPILAGSGVLAGHLWTALLPILFGISVWIPGVAVHVYLAARVRATAQTLDAASRQVVDVLLGATPGPGEIARPTPVVEAPARRVHAHDDDEFFRRKPEARSR